MNSSVVDHNTICINNILSESDKISLFLADYISTNKIPDEIHNELRLVAEEIFVNIVSYAFSDSEPHTIDIELSSNSNDICMTFTDAGLAFNPLTDCDADLDNDDHCEGGMGIPLIKSLTDQQEYNRIRQCNVFTLTKHYTK